MTSPAGQPPDVEPGVDATSAPSAAAHGASWFRSEQDGSAMELVLAAATSRINSGVRRARAAASPSS